MKCKIGVHQWEKHSHFVDGKVKLVKVCKKCGKIKEIK